RSSARHPWAPDLSTAITVSPRSVNRRTTACPAAPPAPVTRITLLIVRLAARRPTGTRGFRHAVSLRPAAAVAARHPARRRSGAARGLPAHPAPPVAGAVEHRPVHGAGDPRAPGGAGAAERLGGPVLAHRDADRVRGGPRAREPGLEQRLRLRLGHGHDR